MKQVKRIFALALAVMMIMSLAVTAFAAEGDITISVTESASGASVDGHTYEVYQIFKGTVAADGKTLSNVSFGANYAPDKSVDDAMAELAEKDPVDAADFLMENKTGDPIAMLNDGNGHETLVAPGYYMVIDVTENLPENETKSAYILEVLDSVAIKSKHDKTPTTYKKIQDINDSTGVQPKDGDSVWIDSADHDIGDLIDFQLNAELPVSFDIFRTKEVEYPFTFHDVEEAGLTFVEITRVYVVTDGVETDISADHYELTTSNDDGCTFEVYFEDLTDVAAVQGGSRIVVEYQSRLNDQAVHGEHGNVNKMRGEYKNYHRPEGPHFTPWDTVIAFTYKVVVNKYDDQEKPQRLEGAEFQLEKFVASATGTVTHEGVQGNWVAKGAPVKTEADTTFTFNGLDDGYYRLTETLTPNGYNTIDPIAFTVTANHDIIWETQNRDDVLTSLTGNKATGEVRDIKFTSEKEDGFVSTDVVNKAGVVLPETGGIGTTIFYVLGGIMVLAAVVLLVTKKRMASAE